jgi:hypothetical protein
MNAARPDQASVVLPATAPPLGVKVADKHNVIGRSLPSPGVPERRTSTNFSELTPPLFGPKGK